MDVKNALLYALGVDKVITFPFNLALSGMTADDFINRVLIADLGASHVVVGADFHFGAGRKGSVDTLNAHPELDVTPITLLGDTHDDISSTRIRGALTQGDIAAANAMLGHDWVIQGEVIHGDKRGREIGFPTANIAFDGTMPPAFGIYAVWVDIGDGIKRAGAANIGLRPMFRLQKPLLEVHLFDFEGDLYGKTLTVSPVKRLRGEENFESLEALVAQISNDCAHARDILICPA